MRGNLIAIKIDYFIVIWYKTLKFCWKSFGTLTNAW